VWNKAEHSHSLRGDHTMAKSAVRGPEVRGFAGDATLPKVCVIGAGCAGFTTAKRLKDYNIPFDVFEASDDIGGNWYYKNPNGMSACYQSLHIDTSKWRLAFEDFPVPAEWPDFPHHAQLLQYFRDYVTHFGLRETINFNTRVTSAHRRGDGLWQVELSTGVTRVYDAVAVCNGHHWDPRLPDPYPGTFTGVTMHSHAYNDPFDPVDLRGKNVVVVGGGNSLDFHAPRRLGVAKILQRQTRGQGRFAALAALVDWPQAGASHNHQVHRPYGRLRLAETRPRSLTRPPLSVGRVSHPGWLR
jgi:Flavin-binding monooxygenase-like